MKEQDELPTSELEEFDMQKQLANLDIIVSVGRQWMCLSSGHALSDHAVTCLASLLSMYKARASPT